MAWHRKRKKRFSLSDVTDPTKHKQMKDALMKENQINAKEINAKEINAKEINAKYPKIPLAKTASDNAEQGINI